MHEEFLLHLQNRNLGRRISFVSQLQSRFCRGFWAACWYCRKLLLNFLSSILNLFNSAKNWIHFFRTCPTTTVPVVSIPFFQNLSDYHGPVVSKPVLKGSVKIDRGSYMNLSKDSHLSFDSVFVLTIRIWTSRRCSCDQQRELRVSTGIYRYFLTVSNGVDRRSRHRFPFLSIFPSLSFDALSESDISIKLDQNFETSQSIKLKIWAISIEFARNLRHI